MIIFTVEKSQAFNLLKEGYSTCSLAQITGAGSHQAIDTWAGAILELILVYSTHFSNHVNN